MDQENESGRGAGGMFSTQVTTGEPYDSQIDDMLMAGRNSFLRQIDDHAKDKTN